MTHAYAARRSAVIGAVLLVGVLLALLPLKWVVVGVPGAIAALLMLIRPELALLPLAFAIPFGSIYEINLGGITVGVTEALIGLILVAWLARSIAFRESDWHWPRISLAVLVFIGATLFSLRNAIALPFALKELFKWVEFLGILLFVANTATEKWRNWVIAALLLAGAAQAALGAYQFLTQSGPEGFILMGRFMRAYGTFEQPNPFAGYLGLVAPLGFALSISLLERKPGQSGSAQEERSLPRWLNWLALGSFGLAAAGIGMSWSRGAWLAFAAAFGAMNLVRSRRGATIFMLLVLLIAFAGLLGSFELLPQAVVQRMTSFLPFATVQDVRAAEINDENYAVLERLAHWESALDMWRDHLWIGVGFGNYEAAYPAYALPKWPLALGHAHNYYLNIAAETGLIGLTAYLALWATVIWQVVRAIWQPQNTTYHTALAVGALGMLVHVSAHNLLDNLWVHNLYIHVAIVLGLVFARPTQSKNFASNCSARAGRNRPHRICEAVSRPRKFDRLNSYK